jgi:hypothetical protein
VVFIWLEKLIRGHWFSPGGVGHALDERWIVWLKRYLLPAAQIEIYATFEGNQ